jgi:DNA-binding transcriptional LysR family regulator
MMDLNDFFLFARVVESNGYAGASRVLNVSKSKLSRRMASMQRRLGVPLLQISTRRFALTQAGQEFYQHCRAVVTEAQAAQDSIEMLRSEPQGTIRVASTILPAHMYLTGLLPQFMSAYPKVRVALHVTNRSVDLIEEGFDIALRVTPSIREEAGMMIKVLARGRMSLVASPRYLKRHRRPTHPRDLAKLDTLRSIRDIEEEFVQWTMAAPDGTVETVALTPRLLCQDAQVTLAAALSGAGVAQLPAQLCRPAVLAGELEEILADWTFPEGIIHLVYPSHRAMLPSVRAFIDFMADRMHGLVK